MAKKSLLQSIRLGDAFHEVVTIDATTQNNYLWNVACPERVRFMGVKVVNTSGGGGACTMTVRNGTNAITNAIDVDQVDTYAQVEGTIDDTYDTIQPGGTVDCFLSATGQDTLIVYLTFLKEA